MLQDIVAQISVGLFEDDRFQYLAFGIYMLNGAPYKRAFLVGVQIRYLLGELFLVEPDVIAVQWRYVRAASQFESVIPRAGNTQMFLVFYDVHSRI